MSQCYGLTVDISANVRDIWKVAGW